jgi:hypothetical protein
MEISHSTMNMLKEEFPQRGYTIANETFETRKCVDLRSFYAHDCHHLKEAEVITSKGF